MPKAKIEIKGFLSFFILHELSKKPFSGDELARSIGMRKGEVLTPGTIYPTLKRLRKQKLVTWKKDGRKKHYSLTALGKKELKSCYVQIKTYFKGMKGYF
ncbi:PadR family transcriptional regulator [Candidatus Woesearchaeota archaeon]|nr:MAG: PadR family transcriptional regulator [Candidatus Woesearchaeota archaeon]